MGINQGHKKSRLAFYAVLFFGLIICFCPLFLREPSKQQSALAETALGEVWDGSKNVAWYVSGEYDGTVLNPYLISTPQELMGLSEICSSMLVYYDSDPLSPSYGKVGTSAEYQNAFSVSDYLRDKYIKLTNDIVFNTYTKNGDGDDSIVSASDFSNVNDEHNLPISFTPIQAFDGVFDGNGKTIKGLFYSGDRNTVALFNQFGGSSNSEIKNLTLLEGFFESSDFNANLASIAYYNLASINSCKSYIVLDGYNAGGIAVRNNGTIKNCANFGSHNANSFGGIAMENNGTITNCQNYADLNAIDLCGGIVAYNYGNISHCQNYNKITSQSYAGGIAGRSYNNNIKFCSNFEEINAYCGGGIAGYLMNATIEGCENYGDVNSQGIDNKAGGIVGEFFVTSEAEHRINACINSGKISGDYGGGIAGTVEGNGTAFAEVVACLNDGEIDGTYKGGIVAEAINAIVDFSYYNKDTSSVTSAVHNGIDTLDLCGLTEAEMKSSGGTFSSHFADQFVQSTSKNGTTLWVSVDGAIPQLTQIEPAYINVTIESWDYSLAPTTVPVVQTSNVGAGLTYYVRGISTNTNYSSYGYDNFFIVRPINIGIYMLTVTADQIGDYDRVSASVIFEIRKVVGTATISISNWYYSQNTKAPKVTTTNYTEYNIQYFGREGTAYEETATPPTQVGKYTVIAYLNETENYLATTAKADFEILAVDSISEDEKLDIKGRISVAFSFSDASIESQTARYDAKKKKYDNSMSNIFYVKYTGAEIKPNVTLSAPSNFEGFTLDNAYTLSFSDNIKTGTAKVIVVGKGLYKGEQTFEFQIVKELPSEVVARMELKRQKRAEMLAKILKSLIRLAPFMGGAFVLSVVLLSINKKTWFNKYLGVYNVKRTPRQEKRFFNTQIFETYLIAHAKVERLLRLRFLAVVGVYIVVLMLGLLNVIFGYVLLVLAFLGMLALEVFFDRIFKVDSGVKKDDCLKCGGITKILGTKFLREETKIVEVNADSYTGEGEIIDVVQKLNKKTKQNETFNKVKITNYVYDTLRQCIVCEAKSRREEATDLPPPIDTAKPVNPDFSQPDSVQADSV